MTLDVYFPLASRLFVDGGRLRQENECFVCLCPPLLFGKHTNPARTSSELNQHFTNVEVNESPAHNLLIPNKESCIQYIKCGY
jgi:hypothetical protein